MFLEHTIIELNGNPSFADIHDIDIDELEDILREIEIDDEICFGYQGDYVIRYIIEEDAYVSDDEESTPYAGYCLILERDEDFFSVVLPAFLTDDFFCDEKTICEALSVSMICQLRSQLSELDAEIENILPDVLMIDTLTEFGLVSLSGNLIEDSVFTRLYTGIINIVENDGSCDIIFSHYSKERERFSTMDGIKDVDSFVEYIYHNESWHPGNDIWLWACDSGVENENGVIISQEIADMTDVMVIGANGTIFVWTTKTEGVLGTYVDYAICNLEGTKWENAPARCSFSFLERTRLIMYLKTHGMSIEDSWTEFYPSR